MDAIEHRADMYLPANHDSPRFQVQRYDACEEVRRDSMNEGGVDEFVCLSDTVEDPEQALASKQRAWQLRDALAKLSARSRRVIEACWLEVDEHLPCGVVRQELAAELGVSTARVCQIERSAMQKLRSALVAFEGTGT